MDAPWSEEKLQSCQETKSSVNHARSQPHRNANSRQGAACMSLACGIDFGTSNSSVGVCDTTGAHLLPIQRGTTSVPTALFFSFDDDSTTFGHDALERY